MKSRLLTTSAHYQAASKLKNYQNAAGSFGVLFFGMQHLPICSVCVCVCVGARALSYMTVGMYACTDPPYTHAHTNTHLLSATPASNLYVKNQ